MGRVRRLAAEAKRRGLECYTYLRPLFHSGGASSRFVIFAQGRTGSWVLYDLLNAHPQVHCDKEILAQRVWYPMRYVEGRAASVSAETYGFHVQVRQLRDIQQVSPGEFLRDLHQQNWHIIYLRRLNMLRQSISSLIALSRRKWYDTAPDPLRGQKFEIDCDQLVERLRRREIDLDGERQSLEGLPYMELVYEDDFLDAAHHQATADRVFAYLSLPSVSVETRFVRLGFDNMADYVSNYAEIVSRISHTQFARYLDER
jgi:LPS sulfotransferase NodH